MILVSKHVGAVLNVLIQTTLCIAGVLIKCLCEMHGAKIKIDKGTFIFM